MKSKNYYEEETVQRDWNMGVRFYETLSDLKMAHIIAFTEGQLKESILVLASEIDWVSTDIDKDLLTKFRGQIDSILLNLHKPNYNKHNILNQILMLRRNLWDEEMAKNITRPKEKPIDKSKTRMPGLE